MNSIRYWAHQYYYGFNNWDHCDDSCPGYQASARRSHQKVGGIKIIFKLSSFCLCVKIEPEPEPEPISTCVAWTGLMAASPACSPSTTK